MTGYKVFLRKIWGDIRWSLINIFVLSILVLSLITILPTSNAIQFQLDQINKASNALIEVRPQKDSVGIIDLDVPPFILVNKINEYYKSGLFFTSSDLEKLSQIPHVKRVIGGVILYIEIFWGYSKCFEEATREFILDFYIKQIESEYGTSRENILQQLEEEASRRNISIYDYVYELSKVYFTKKNEILVINTSETIDIISYFNNLVDGEDIVNRHKDILLTIDALRISYINYSMNKVITCDETVDIGDEGQILFRNIIGNSNIVVRLSGIIPSSYLIKGVMDTKLYNDIINNITSILPKDTVENITNLTSLYSVAYIIVDEPHNINNVIKMIKSKFPNAQVIPVSETYQISSAAIGNLKNSLNLINIFVITTILISLLGLRIFETSKKKRELGLIKSFGWSFKMVFTYYALPILIVGLCASIISTIIYWLISPTITTILLNEFRKSIPPALSSRLITILEYGMSKTSLYQIFGYALTIGILASLVLTLIPLIYYNKLELEDVLREE